MLLYNYASVLRDLGRGKEAASYLESAATKARKENNQILIDQTDLQRARMYADNREYARAAQLLTQTEPRLRKKFPPNHYAFAALASDRSRLALDTGDTASALRLANQAIDLDEASIKEIGECAAFVPMLLIRRSSVELKAQRPDQAETDAVHALHLLNEQSESGIHSSNIGRAYLALALALRAQGKLNESQDAFRNAFQNLQDTLGPGHPDTQASLSTAHLIRSGN
jgi:tetratricopeptide (TPR) repeat protein